MSASAVTKQQPKEISKADNAAVIEEREQSAKASASAGLNLNVFGALAGAFSGKNSKKTEEDGSTLEEKEQSASVGGAGAGNLNAGAKGAASTDSRHRKAAILETNAA